jgi:hypothetical protein
MNIKLNDHTQVFTQYHPNIWVIKKEYGTL